MTDDPPPSDPAMTSAAARVNAAHQELRQARRALYRALERRARRPGRQAGDCGSAAGYRRHERAHELPCDACIDGRTWDRNRRDHRLLAVVMRRTA